MSTYCLTDKDLEEILSSSDIENDQNDPDSSHSRKYSEGELMYITRSTTTTVDTIAGKGIDDYYNSYQCSTFIQIRSQTDPSLPQSKQFTNNPRLDINNLVRSVAHDMTAAKQGGQWLLSCYAPFRGKPAYPGFEDHSFEEIRLGYYEARQNGTVEQYKQQMAMLRQQTVTKMNDLQTQLPDAVDILKNLYNTVSLSDHSISGINVATKKTTLDDFNSSQLSNLTTIPYLGNSKHQSQLASNRSNIDMESLVDSVVNDMVVAEMAGIWPLSCYAPFKDKPAYPGFEDHSFEEIRFAYYEAVHNGTVEQYKHHIQTLFKKALVKIKSLQSPSSEVVNILRNIYDTFPSSCSGVYRSEISTALTAFDNMIISSDILHQKHSPVVKQHKDTSFFDQTKHCNSPLSPKSCAETSNSVTHNKVRSQATVLKKAVLDEQTKNTALADLVKKHEQSMRKRDQEIESLVFRNDQLTKRIMVLQQDLQNNSGSKKNKHKSPEISSYNETDVINEELQKKIVENAQLFNTVSEKDLEIYDYKEKINKLEEIVSNLQKEYDNKETNLKKESNKYKTEVEELRNLVKRLSSYNETQSYQNDKSDVKEDCESVEFWKSEARRWKAECDLLRSKPDSNDKLTNYYEQQISDILERNVLVQSEIKTLWAENISLKKRLENLTLEHCKLKDNMEVGYEELITTNKNYKSQLDAMTEHLAAQNEKIANQCDEIQDLRHKLSLKK